MRILHLIESLEFGGAEKVVIGLANELAKTHDVSICCIKGIGALGGSVDQRIRLLCLDKGEGNDYGIPFRLAKILKDSRIDVLHTHNWGVFLEGAIAGALSRTLVQVHTVHGPYIDYAPGWWSIVKQTLRHRLERIFASRFTKIVTVSDSIQRYICDEIGISVSQMITIHNGIHIEEVTGTAERGGNVKCITVGRLAKVKNQAMMIRAFHMAECQNASLWLVGDGPERASLEALTHKLGLSERVVFAGFRHDVNELLAQSHVFLISSVYEGISVAVLEAMRVGLPVVGTRVGGMAETVNERTGILVEVDDVNAMAHALRKLINSSQIREQLGAAGRRFLKEEFSIQSMVARYELVYKGTST